MGVFFFLIYKFTYAKSFVKAKNIGGLDLENVYGVLYNTLQ